MAVSSCSELPIIDFSEDAMKPGTETWDLRREHVRKALEEYGWFEAKFNEINHELYTAAFSSLEKMFDLPKETKRQCSSDVPFYGYASDSPISPLLESMGLAPLTFQAIQNLALLMWPQGDPTFCETLHSYVSRVLELEEKVRKVIFQSYGLENHFEKESESMKCSVRLMKYGAPMTDKDTLGVGMHYDKNFITILQSDGAGLQVRDKHGEWITPTSSSSSSFIVMIGESFHGWSNGRLKCPLHRVRLSGHKSRYSVAFFSSKNGKVEIPSELVDEQHPLLFKPFDHAALMQIFKQQVTDKTHTGDDENCVPILTTHFAVI